MNLYLSFRMQFHKTFFYNLLHKPNKAQIEKVNNRKSYINVRSSFPSQFGRTACGYVILNLQVLSFSEAEFFINLCSIVILGCSLHGKSAKRKVKINKLKQKVQRHYEYIYKWYCIKPLF